jgi:BNR repeat-containing family member
MNWFRFVLVFFIATCAALETSAQTTNPIPVIQTAVAVDSLDVAPVPAAYPVGFTLLTHPPYQFVAFYNQHRRLVVAQRRLDQRKWHFNKLPDYTGWDSHNYIALVADDDGYLHLSADMHVKPLKYFRTAKPWDASTFKVIDRMTGSNETHCTYPDFLRGTNNELLFTYRDGHSGGGNQIYNIYDLPTKTWHRFLDAPLTDGQGTNCAYFNGPFRGPDGWYHLAWVWRANPDASTCHDLTYARSRDLQHWETSSGQPLSLPIRLDNCEIVDPVPEHGGMNNGDIRLGFDAEGRVTISYLKNDANGNTQPFTARLEDGHWALHQIADWPVPCDVSGTGTLVSVASVGRVEAMPDGMLTEHYRHFKFGTNTWVLDPQTLRATGEVTRQFAPPELDTVTGTFPGLEVHWENDTGKSGVAGLEYKLRWETLSVNRDRPRKGKLPDPSELKVIAVQVNPPNPDPQRGGY